MFDVILTCHVIQGRLETSTWLSTEQMVRPDLIQPMRSSVYVLAISLLTPNHATIHADCATTRRRCGLYCPNLSITLSLCLSVRLSRAGVVSKQLNV